MLFGELLCLKDPRLWFGLNSMSSSEMRSDLSFSLPVRCCVVSECVEMLGTLGSVLRVDLLMSSLGLGGPEVGPWAAFVVCSCEGRWVLVPLGFAVPVSECLGLWLSRLDLVFF